MSKSCSTLVVYWTKPHSNGSPVTAYHIEVNSRRTTTVKGGLTEATLTDLAPQTDYKYVTMVTKIVINIFSSQGSEYSQRTKLEWAHSGNADDITNNPIF